MLRAWKLAKKQWYEGTNVKMTRNLLETPPLVSNIKLFNSNVRELETIKHAYAPNTVSAYQQNKDNGDPPRNLEQLCNFQSNMDVCPFVYYIHLSW